MSHSEQRTFDPSPEPLTNQQLSNLFGNGQLTLKQDLRHKRIRAHAFTVNAPGNPLDGATLYRDETANCKRGKTTGSKATFRIHGHREVFNNIQKLVEFYKLTPAAEQQNAGTKQEAE